MERLNEIALRKAEIKALLESEEEVDVEAIRTALENAGTKIVFMPFVPGYSTTGTIEKIRGALLKEMQDQP